MARAGGRKVVLLGGMVALAGGLWFFRGLIPGPWADVPVTGVSEEAAASADQKLARLRADGDTIRLTDVEFTSYLRFRMADRFAVGIESAGVAFDGDRARVTGRLPTDRLPKQELGRGAEFLPDTADVSVGGTLRTMAAGRAALRVESLSFAKFPIPRDTYLRWLDRVGGVAEPGLERDEVAFQLPPGVGYARIQDGLLVLAR